MLLVVVVFLHVISNMHITKNLRKIFSSACRDTKPSGREDVGVERPHR